MLPNILCMQSQWPTVSGWLRIIPNSSARWKSISNVHILDCIYTVFVDLIYKISMGSNLHCFHLKLLAAKQTVRPSFILKPVWKHCVLHTVLEIEFMYFQEWNCTANFSFLSPQFLHSCVCEGFKYSQDRSTYLAAAK
jgi:hypothetical protein